LKGTGKILGPRVFASEPESVKTAERPVAPDLSDTLSAHRVYTSRVTYTVLLKQTEEGVSVWCPGLPGCWSEGATEEEAVKNIADAIQEYLLARETVADEAVGAKKLEIKVDPRVA
jgi:predicted RNase H-like HicB family nuclease